MAALIRERFGVEVETVPSGRSGEFTVSLDGRRVARKVLPFVRPSDRKLLDAVARALG